MADFSHHTFNDFSGMRTPQNTFARQSDFSMAKLPSNGGSRAGGVLTPAGFARANRRRRTERAQCRHLGPGLLGRGELPIRRPMIRVAVLD